ncbi:UvrD-helicase domain-containing protein, partial [Gemella sp. GH3]|uniref:ATP-dependent helicase n=1 Tax=unclassified Gemella TaxID=2624949 RepID=UPI0015D0B9D4
LLNYNKNFTILDSSEQKSIIKNILKNLNYSEEQYNPNAILKLISNAKNNYIKPKDMEAQSRFGFMKIVAEVYFEYEKYLKKNSVLDFDDLIIKVIELFEKYPEILLKYQQKFQYIHVDEYQDTNVIQYKLIRMLSAIHNNICVVGDDDQSIYSWRGACSDNIKNFEKDFDNTKLIFLDQNYRSNSIILNAANNIIKNNNHRKEKNLWSEKKIGKKIHLYSAYNDVDESEFVAKNIKNLISKGIEYKDIAVLYRANYLSRSLENTLLTTSIPYKLIGSLKFLQRQEVKDILSYLNVLVNKDDELSLRRIINVPKRGIGAAAMEKIQNYSNENNLSLYDTLSQISSVGVSKKVVDNITKLYSLFEKYSTDDSLTIDEVIVGIYIDSGYEEMLKNSKDDYADSRIENISELVTSAKQYSETNNSLVDYISEMSLTSASDDENFENAVTLSTIHASKGLEYEVVFIIGLEENIFPSMRDIDSLEDELDKLEEERRLAYVAVTRAKERLFLSHTNRRMQFGNVKFNDKSRFIKEIPEQLIQEESSVRLANLNNSYSNNNVTNFISKLSPKIKEKKSISNKSINYTINDRVQHKKFGIGTVTKMDNNAVTVDFDNYGTKILLLEYANLVKE